MSDSTKHYDIIYAGNYTKDTNITPDGTWYVDGDGMNYAAHARLQLGIKTAIVTCHVTEVEHFGFHIQFERKIHHFKLDTQSMAGRSGRGDTCVGSYVAKQLSLPPREAGKWAAAATSLKVEKHGVFDRSISEVEAFIAKHYVD